MVSHSEVVHVGKEDVDLDHLLDAGAGSGEHGLQVLDASTGLFLDGTLDEVTRSIQWDLTGTVDSAGGLDGLGLWCMASVKEQRASIWVFSS